MSKNIKQVYDTNPITSNTSTDLMYFGQSPYGITNDAAMLYSNFAAQFTPSATIAAAGKVLRSNGSSWVASTSTFADTYGVSTLLYASGANTVTGLATVNSAGLLTSAGGVPGWVAYTGSGAPVLATSPTFVTSLTSPTATFTGAALTNKQFTANSSTAITIDPANGPYQTITLTGNALITLASVPSATTEREFILELVQDGTGSRTVSWSNITFASNGGALPVISTAAGTSTYIGISGTSSAWIGYPVNQGLGVTDASNAPAGYIGEVISSTIAIGSAVSLTSGTALSITSISLTPGDWQVYGNIGFIAASTTLITVITGSISATTNTQATSPNAGSFAQLSLPFTASTTQVLPIGASRVNISATTTYYLVATATFSTSTCTGYGSLTARRMR